MVSQKELDLFHRKIAKRVRKLRKEKKMTMRDLAKKADIHYTYFSSLEKGERNISSDNLYKISKALKCDICDLLK